MDAVQVMRKKAKDKGALESNEQQKVETKVVEKTEVIVVQSANPEVVYVPSYSPTVVYGAPIYPYPPIYYPYYPPGAAFVSFSVGMMWGAAMWGGACCRYGWGGGGNVYINHNNNFNNINVNNNRNNINRGGNNWQHNPSHRGGTPYGDRATTTSTAVTRAGNRARDGPRRRGRERPERVREPRGCRRRGERPERVGQPRRCRRSGGVGGSDKIGNQNIPRDAGSRAGASDRSGSRDSAVAVAGVDSAAGRVATTGGARGPAAPAARAAWAVAAAGAGTVEAAEEEGVVDERDHLARRTGASASAAGVLGLLAGCGRRPRARPPRPPRLTRRLRPRTPHLPGCSPARRARQRRWSPRRRSSTSPTLKAILGGGGADLVESEDTVQDRQDRHRVRRAGAREAAPPARLDQDDGRAHRSDRATGRCRSRSCSTTASGTSTRRPGGRRSSAGASAATSSTRSRCAMATSRPSGNTP